MSTTDITILPPDVELPAESSQSIISAYQGYFEKARELTQQAEGITSPKIARVMRLELKGVRVEAEKTRKNLKEDSIRVGKAIDGANNILLAIITPVEQRLDEIEKAEERRIAAENEARRQERRAQLAPYGVVMFMDSPTLGTMPQEDFDAILSDAKAIHEQRVKREQEEAAAALAQQVAEAKERERVRLENEKLLREAAEREAAAQVERERAAREKAELEAKLAQERAEAERKAEYERQLAEAREKEAAEKARKEREALEAKHRAEQRKAEAKAAEERAAREKAEAEAARQREELLEKQRQVIEAENARLAEEARKQREAEELAEKAAQAPDREKLLQYARALGSIPVPSCKSKKARNLVQALVTDILEAANSLREAAEKL